ncbi:MAG TPA: hypothetical protein GXZ87_08465 [Bacteroidales bacterium]|nr:hypothetical protein [Bacteroidales bacterium]
MDKIAETVLKYSIEKSTEFQEALDDVYQFQAESHFAAIEYLEYILDARYEYLVHEELIEFKMEDSEFNDIVGKAFYAVKYNTPMKIKALLDTKVIGQEEAKKDIKYLFWVACAFRFLDYWDKRKPKRY